MNPLISNRMAFFAACAVLLVARASVRAQEPAVKYAVVHHHDFRGDLPDWLTILRDREGRFSAFEKDGLRITLPKERDNYAGVTLRPLINLQGDFEVTVGFAILEVELPGPGAWGYGVTMRIEKQDSAEAATIARLAKPNGNQVVFWDRAYLGPDGNLKFNGGGKPCDDKNVRLGFKRTGKTLHYLWADGQDAPFQILNVNDFGTDDLKPIGINVMTAKMFGKIDVRFLSIDIKSGGSDPAAPPPAARPDVAAAPPAARTAQGSRGMLAVLLAAGFGVTLLVALGIGLWVYLRQRRRATPVIASKGAKS